MESSSNIVVSELFFPMIRIAFVVLAGQLIHIGGVIGTLSPGFEVSL